MLTGLHFLLTYKCIYECDHCFLHCGPRSEGTFTLDQIEAALKQGVDAGIDHIYVEGGEPFLYYPVMVETVRLARALGLDAGIVTNCYWATSERDAIAWLRPLVELGINDFSVSDDAFHSEDPERSPAKIAAAAAAKLGLPAASICIEAPTIEPSSEKAEDGAVVGGDVLFKGRAADTLTADLPRKSYTCFDSCPHEELEKPSRVHLDPFGNVFVCQGISIGSIWQTPLKKLMESYRPHEHPIVGPLLEGGPAALARKYGLPDGETYVDHCHLCYLARKAQVEQLPDILCPKGVYGELGDPA
jgi:hypothetical protein